MSDTLIAHPPAKINLSLEVLSRREDGYHELLSVMQTVSLSDVLVARPAAQTSVTCDMETLANTDNLVARAVGLVSAAAGTETGCELSLEKRIPVGAGLGGGSSDAAAALAAANRLLDGGLNCPRLVDLAAKLGSDVPYFLYGGTALVSGRGETVRPLPSPPLTWFLLVNPGFHVSTARVFAALTPGQWDDGSATREVADRLESSGSVTVGRNSLQSTLFRLYPAAEECFRAVEEAAPGRTIVSGSGPTVLSVCATREDAEQKAARLRPLGYWVAVTRGLMPEGWETPCR